MREHGRRALCLLIVPLLSWSACASELASDEADIEAGHEVSGQRQALVVQPIDTITFNATADTSIRTGLLTSPNANYGTQKTLSISRALVRVDQSAIDAQVNPLQGDYIVSAKLRLTVTPTLLVSLPRILSAYRVTRAWTESGATWNCAVDSNTSNSSADCAGATKWSSAGGDFATSASGSAVLPLTLNQASVVEIDVTQDLRDFKQNGLSGGLFGQPNYGWIVKTLVDLTLDSAVIASRESTAPPQLVLQVRRCNTTVCDDGILCSDDNFCDSQGFCTPHPAAGAPCDLDGNPCTLDLCANSDFSCVAGAPAPVGTMCGSGLECNAQQQCVPPTPASPL